MAFDISAQKAAAAAEDEGYKVHVPDREGNPVYYGPNGDKPVTITMAGRYSSRYRRIDAEIKKRPFKGKKLTQGSFEDEATEKVIACAMAWEGFEDNGVPIEMTRQNLAALFSGCEWVLNACAEAMNDPSNFSKRS